MTPWYRATRAFDRHRLAEIEADLAGTTYRTPDPAWAMTTALYAAALHDPDVLRAQSSIAGMLAIAARGAWPRRGCSRRSSPSVPTRPRYPEPRRGTTSWSPRSSRMGRPRVADRPGDAAPPRVRLFVQDEGAGEPVLLLHGWPDTHALWRHQVPALDRAGYRTIAPDLRGFGASDKPADVADVRHAPVLGDLLGLLDRLDVRSGARRRPRLGRRDRLHARGPGARPGEPA